MKGLGPNVQFIYLVAYNFIDQKHIDPDGDRAYLKNFRAPQLKFRTCICGYPIYNCTGLQLPGCLILDHGAHGDN